MKKTLASLLAATVLMTGSAAMAEQPGYYVGGEMGVVGPSTVTTNRGVSGGLGVFGGYSFGPVSLEAQYLMDNFTNSGGYNVGNVNMNMLGVGILLHPWSFGKFTPYIKAGSGLGFFSGNAVVSSSIMYDVGAGVRYDVTKNVSVGLEYTYLISDAAAVRDNWGNATNLRDNIGMVTVRYKF